MAGAQTSRDLDLYEIAYLAGGLPRVVDTAVIAMVETGQIRVLSPGQLVAAEPTRRHPVEAAVLDAVGTKGHRSVDTIRWRLADDDRILEIGRRLAAEGLLSRWSARLHGDHRPPVPTRPGRQLIRSLVDRPPADPARDGGSALLVALHGRARVIDPLLRASIFDFPRPPLAGEAGAHPPSELDFADGYEAARRTRAQVSAQYNKFGHYGQ